MSFVKVTVVFCSFTERVKEIIDVLKELNRGVYKRTMVTSRKEDNEADQGKFVICISC